jgi:hypothetical protein
LAPCAPGDGGCQRFVEPVLFPLLYNPNLLVINKGIFEDAKIYKNDHIETNPNPILPIELQVLTNQIKWSKIMVLLKIVIPLQP